MGTPGHLAPGLWRHPRNRSTKYNTTKYWADIAKIFRVPNNPSLFVADVLGPYDVYKGPSNFTPGLASASQIPMSGPFLAISAMASVTTHLSFGITASTTYENPYLLARRFATLGHLIAPADSDDIVKYLLPERRRRGVFRDEYAASTRENFFQDGLGPRLGEDHPGSAYKWVTGE